MAFYVLDERCIHTERFFWYKLRLIFVGLFNGSSDVALLIHLSFIEVHNEYMHCKQYYTLPTH